MTPAKTYTIGDDCLDRLRARRRRLFAQHWLDQALTSLGLGNALRHTQALRVTPARARWS